MLETKVHSKLGNLHKIKLNKPHLIIGVLGCMAQNLKDDLLKNKPYVDIILGPDSYRKIPDLINRHVKNNKSIVDTKLSRYEVYENLFPSRGDTFNAWVSIMRGCDKFCSFCIVPFTRGRERSRSVDSVVEEVKKAVDQGFVEITLLGQNVNSYNFEGKVAYLTSGEKVSVEQLLEFLLVYSANDSAYATAMHISNSVDEFVKLMNTRAKKLNMVNTNFQNPDGLDQENHYTTINDLLILSEYILRNTKLIDITNKSNFYYEQNGEVKKYENTNLILKNGFQGLKTGWTSKAGLTFIGYNQENNRNILTIVNRSIVDNNKENHFEDTLFLYKESLANFQDYLLLSNSEYVYKIINSSGSLFHSYNYDIIKFGNINTPKHVHLKSIDRSD